MKTELNLQQTMFRAAGLLSLFVVVSVGLLIGVNAFTQPKITEAERLALLQTINQVMPSKRYNNDLIEDSIIVEAPDLLGSAQTRIYRARLDNQPAGLVIETIAPNGYSGNIYLLVGVLANGEVSGVRVLSHRETPGLGDKIELRKDNWILSFDGRRLTEDNSRRWAVKRDRGEFDQFTGATITPRAIVGAVRNTLDYVNQQGAQLYE
ncbi:electron transport complex subunit RsxG [Thiomicrospira microaerophila]|uniref:electron transport complex subunit RsxG n=1 Tax=Thiomicrospira microaerophila TaxID=406020 RepID=UPI00200F7A93|nr:electron transport complex subunit RsxG [Thiomicrospira microaerophila]UQB43011.1 electron transport complex subunit RsxG [Thiomicrospira microaerophila]